MNKIVWIFYFVLFFFVNFFYCLDKQNFCSKDDVTNECRDNQNIVNIYKPQARYILYDVNPSEGFNLRRDVYLRLAIMVHNFRKSKNHRLNSLILVLPPWPHLYHWQSKDIFEQRRLPWSLFFDITSLQKFAPVIEMSDFFAEAKSVSIDETYTLENFEEMFESGVFFDKVEVRDCKRRHFNNFYGFPNISTKINTCLGFQGHASKLKTIFEKSESQIFMFNHAEIVLHDEYGGRTFWEARRSMRFNEELVKIANDFRKTIFNSTDVLDGINRPDDWTLEKPKRTVKGGNYLCVHLRRKDFIHGRPNDVPSLESASKQLRELLQKLKFDNIFISTDSPDAEFKKLSTLLKSKNKNIKTKRFTPSEEQKEKFKDGGIAIIDQIICSHAAYFVGTHESTFTYRIQEEREILGFPEHTTFNQMCGNDNPKSCKKSSVWKIVY